MHVHKLQLEIRITLDKKDFLTLEIEFVSQTTYVQSFMGYTEDQTNLIFEIFRHKLVHLAQPRGLYSFKGKTVAWQYDHENTSSHLILQDLMPPQEFYIKNGWSVKSKQLNLPLNET